MSIHPIGTILCDRYEIIGELGTGGMQEVFKVKDHVFGERLVALKTPKNHSGMKRFDRSAIVSAKVNHPNVAKTLDFFAENQRQYLIEEYVEGQDLHKVMDRIPQMDPYLCAQLIHHIARGLSASHHAGVVHRDLKPSNIMISTFPSFETIKITDFGIAKMAEEEIADAAQDLTTSQTAMGALPYLAPEMIESPRNAGPPSDVWALGAMGFEFLTGTKPFGSGFKAAARIINHERGKIPIVPNPQFARLYTEIATIIEKCLQEDPKRRPKADELVSMCGTLWYATSERYIGRVNNWVNTSYGFINSKSGKVFFHKASVFGSLPETNAPVCYSKFSGSPGERAHPVILLSDSAF